MNIILHKALVFPLALLSAGVVLGDYSRVEAIYFNGYWNSESEMEPLVDESGIALTAGGPENDDGAIFQIGYFEGVDHLLEPSSFGDNEWDQFTPLTGIGSPNAERHPTTIGGIDSNAIGPFGFLFYPSAVPIELDPAFDLGLPDSYPVRLGMRFFSAATLEDSKTYNIVSSDNLFWLLQEPEPEPGPLGGSVLNMDDHTLFWASGPEGAFQTSMTLIPEPGSVCLVLLGGLVLTRRRR